jgi:hypothetical protein
MSDVNKQETRQRHHCVRGAGDGCVQKIRQRRNNLQATTAPTGQRAAGQSLETRTCLVAFGLWSRFFFRFVCFGYKLWSNNVGKMTSTAHFILLAVLLTSVAGQFEWQPRDTFDEVRHRIDKVNRSLLALSRAWFILFLLILQFFLLFSFIKNVNFKIEIAFGEHLITGLLILR